MKILRRPGQVRAWSRSAKRRGQTVGFVPTMGALHEGHLSLVRRAKRECRRVIVSIFVNPLQFGPPAGEARLSGGPGEDFRRYPRDLKGDVAKLRRGGVDCVFAPSALSLYPRGYQTSVEVEKLAKPLCGKFRPGHFKGVATVCAKLFAIVEPDRAYFGEKDFQQLRVVETLVEDLDLPIQIRRHPIVREKEGLAMSSRNRTLSPAERREAILLYRSLSKAKEAIRRGQRRAVVLERMMRQTIRQSKRIRVDYLSAVDPKDLSPCRRIKGRVLLAGAIRIGRTRLIDNMLVKLKD